MKVSSARPVDTSSLESTVWAAIVGIWKVRPRAAPVMTLQNVSNRYWGVHKLCRHTWYPIHIPDPVSTCHVVIRAAPTIRMALPTIIKGV